MQEDCKLAVNFMT